MHHSGPTYTRQAHSEQTQAWAARVSERPLSLPGSPPALARHTATEPVRPSDSG